MTSSATKRVFLARHGQSLANLEKRISGQIDYPLSPKGRDQALSLCDVLTEQPLDAVFSSTLTRAVQTARPTADHHALKIVTRDELKEINLGVLQGRSMEEDDARTRALWRTWSEAGPDYAVPGGESFAQFEARIHAWLDTLLDNLSGSALLVAHRNTNEVILARVLSLGRAAELNLNVKNKYLYDIELDDPPRVTTIRLGGECHGQRYPGLKFD